jgi:hypothetical protein
MMRILARICLVLLAAEAVLVVTWATTRPYDGRQEMAAQEAAAKGSVPMPGSEAALRKGIDDILSGRRTPQAQQQMEKMGPLRSVAYLGGVRSGLLPGMGSLYELFRMEFRNGTLEGMVVTGKDGVPTFAGWRNVEPPTPQQIVEGYAAFPPGVRAMRTLTQLGVLLAAALIGRLLLRVRL